ncbi:hypothetical protein HYZ99_04715 [Candidatus Peregrinibacteria bacterium]|nr:hypothetical protein [Candidatus Peregrinibacteria bacterium]
MANRDVALGLCGVVVGVLLGAGSVLYTEDATLGAASTDVAAYFDLDRGDRANVREDAGARFLERLDGADTSNRGNRPTQYQGEEETAPVHSAARVTARCALVQEAFAPVLSVLSTDQRKYGQVYDLAMNTVASYCD